MSKKVQCFAIRSGKSKNELQHWKYIKKKKLPNGKWRYYYDVKDMMGYDEKEAYEEASKNYKRAESHATIANRYAGAVNNKHVRNAMAEGRWDPYTGEVYLNSKEKKEISDAYDRYWEAKDRAKQRSVEVRAPREAYDKTPLGKIDSIKSDAKYIADTGKNWLKKKLGIH